MGISAATSCPHGMHNHTMEWDGGSCGPHVLLSGREMHSRRTAPATSPFSRTAGCAQLVLPAYSLR